MKDKNVENPFREDPSFRDDRPFPVYERDEIDGDFFSRQIDAPSTRASVVIILLCLAALIAGALLNDAKAETQVVGDYLGMAQFSDAPSSRILLSFPEGRLGFQGKGTLRLLDRCHTHGMRFNQSQPRTLVMTSDAEMESHNAGFSCVARYTVNHQTIAGNCMWKVPGDNSPYGSRFAFIAGKAVDYTPPELPDHCASDNQED